MSWLLVKVQKFIKCLCNKALSDNCFLRNWELFKFEVAKYLREYGSILSKSRKIEETNVITRIIALTQTSPENLSENFIKELFLQQNKLNEIYRMKVEGAFVRSRSKWLEEGEQNTAYFFQLERSCSKTNSIQKLSINGVITDDPRKIADYCSTFYRNLYESGYSEVVANHFLGCLTNIKSMTL